MKRAEHYVKVFVDYAEADALNVEMGQLSITVLGKLVDHCGEMPSSSGYYFDVVSGKVDRMRKLHRDFRRATELMWLAGPRARAAMIVWEWFIGRRPEYAEKTLKTGKDVAEHLGLEYEPFKKSRQRGLDKINAELGVFVA